MTTTEAKLKSAAEFLARELFEAKNVPSEICGRVWDGKDFLMDTDKWLPYADTKEGLFQCLGKGGIVEKMGEKGGYLFELWSKDGISFICTFNGSAVGRGAKTEAITLAAATACGWKEE